MGAFYTLKVCIQFKKTKDEIEKLSHKYANMNGRINGKWKKVEIPHALSEI